MYMQLRLTLILAIAIVVAGCQTIGPGSVQRDRVDYVGAIAHGHPIGAAGAVLATRLMHSMKRDALKRGVATLCIGGGQGIALAIEML
jgi:acetyl-CoA acetyltransferase